MPAMPSLHRIQLQLILTALFPCLASGDSEVTLWQFGVPRLLDAEVTLPLIPLGTVPGGAATTYLYQDVNPTIVVVEGASFTLSITATRTIIASASGWFEPFPDRTANIACGFVESTFGQCFDGLLSTTTVGNSGEPTPVVFAVSTPQPTSTTQSSISATFGSVTLGVPISTGSTAPSGSFPKPLELVAPIVAGALAGIALLALAVRTLNRRRRVREYLEKPEPFDIESSWHPEIAMTPSLPRSFPSDLTFQAGQAGQNKRRELLFPSHAIAVTATASPPGHPGPHAPQRTMSSTGTPYARDGSNVDSATRPVAGTPEDLPPAVNANGLNIPTPELVRMLYQRLQTENANEMEAPPPMYATQ